MCLKRVGVDEQSPLQASKWQHIPVLLDLSELTALIKEIMPVRLFHIGSLRTEEELECTVEQFLANYTDYISLLRGEAAVEDHPYRTAFTLALTENLDAVYVVELANGKCIARPYAPVIQLQLHRLSFSSVDRKVRSMVHGENTISWGIQFSFPQLYLDPQTKRVLTGKEFSETPNARKFRLLQRWVRHNSLPTPFLIDGQRVNSPIRLGKTCFSWIAHHPDLVGYKDLTIAVTDSPSQKHNGDCV